MWTDQAWSIAEAMIEAHGYAVSHCAHCSGRFGRGIYWGVPGHPHPTCLVVPVSKTIPLPWDKMSDPEYFTGC